jgi:hypothetical protein
LGQLKNNLKRRGYKQSIIKKIFNEANNISRSSLLQYKEKQKCKRIPCVLTLLPIVVLGFDISARTNRFLRLFGCLKATMGG